MKTVSYKDPYEPLLVVIQIEDDDEKGLKRIPLRETCGN